MCPTILDFCLCGIARTHSMLHLCCFAGPFAALGSKPLSDDALTCRFLTGFEETRERQMIKERTRRELKQNQRRCGKRVAELRFCDDPFVCILNTKKFDPEVPRRVPAPPDHSIVNNSYVEEDPNGRSAYHEQVDEDEELLFPLLAGYRACIGRHMQSSNRYECHNHPQCSIDEDFEDGKLFSVHAGISGCRKHGYGRPCKNSEADMGMLQYIYSISAANKIERDLKVLPNGRGTPKSMFARNPEAQYCDPGDPYWPCVKEGKVNVLTSRGEPIPIYHVLLKQMEKLLLAELDQDQR